uniref:SH3 domain-containing protein n=1 Tax=Alexandrium monilatum TaxID=311494 RepID=A0A7S4UAA1_9DINO|mmetsp:Transcript_76702/g.238884  ORF Transcript_76702/g.238884 Transcript_76702/m.238884 type:complete len:519 (+) Transcript_76702:96-1652(+)
MIGRQGGGDGQAFVYREGRVLADFDGKAYGPDYLTLACGERVMLLASRQEDAGWAYGACGSGARGWFPLSYWEAMEAPKGPAAAAATSSGMHGRPEGLASTAAAAASPMVASAAVAAQDEYGDSGLAGVDQAPGRPPMPSWVKASRTNSENLNAGRTMASRGMAGVSGAAGGLSNSMSSLLAGAGSEAAASVGQPRRGPARPAGAVGDGRAVSEESMASLMSVLARSALDPTTAAGAQTQPARAAARAAAQADNPGRQILSILHGESEASEPRPQPAAAQARATASVQGPRRGAPADFSSSAGPAAAGPSSASSCSAAVLGEGSRLAEATARFVEDPRSGLRGPPSTALPQTALPFNSWQRGVYSRAVLLQARTVATEDMPETAEERARVLGIQLMPRFTPQVSRLTARADSDGFEDDASRSIREDDSGPGIREGAIATLLQLAGGSAKVGQLAAAVLALGIKTGSHREVCQSICVEVCNKPDMFVPLPEGALGVLELNKLTVALRSGMPNGGTDASP